MCYGNARDVPTKVMMSLPVSTRLPSASLVSNQKNQEFTTAVFDSAMLIVVFSGLTREQKGSISPDHNWHTPPQRCIPYCSSTRYAALDAARTWLPRHTRVDSPTSLYAPLHV